MRTHMRWMLLWIVILSLAWPGSALARSLAEDRVVFGGSYTLKSGETLNGDLAVFGGNATLEAGSTVTGDVVLIGGNLDASGTIAGDVVGLGGLVSLGETAVVEGNVTLVGAHLTRAPGAIVRGEVFSGVSGPFTFSLPGSVEIPRLEVRLSPVFQAASFLLRAFLWTALAVLLVLFLPEATQRVAQTALRQPLAAGGVGLLTLMVIPPALLLLTLTILLIPLSLALAMVAVVAWAFGLVAVGYEVGRRLAQLLKQDWAPAVCAGAGTFLLIVVLNGLKAAIPCVGWTFPALVGSLGLGAVVLTRFGSQVYPPLTMISSSPAAPPLPSESAGGEGQGASGE